MQQLVLVRWDNGKRMANDRWQAVGRVVKVQKSQVKVELLEDAVSFRFHKVVPAGTVVAVKVKKYPPLAISQSEWEARQAEVAG